MGFLLQDIVIQNSGTLSSFIGWQGHADRIPDRAIPQPECAAHRGSMLPGLELFPLLPYSSRLCAEVLYGNPGSTPLARH